MAHLVEELRSNTNLVKHSEDPSPILVHFRQHQRLENDGVFWSQHRSVDKHASGPSDSIEGIGGTYSGGRLLGSSIIRLQKDLTIPGEGFIFVKQTPSGPSTDVEALGIISI